MTLTQDLKEQKFFPAVAFFSALCIFEREVIKGYSTVTYNLRFCDRCLKSSTCTASEAFMRHCTLRVSSQHYSLEISMQCYGVRRVHAGYICIPTHLK